MRLAIVGLANPYPIDSIANASSNVEGVGRFAIGARPIANMMMPADSNRSSPMRLTILPSR